MRLLPIFQGFFQGNKVDLVKKFGTSPFLCVLCLWITLAGTGLYCMKSTVFDGVYSHVQLIHQSAVVESYHDVVYAFHFRSFVGKSNRVTASVSSSPDSWAMWDCRDDSDEDAGMDREDEGEDEISYDAALEVAVVSNAQGCNKKTTKVTSKSSSHSARMILQNLLIKSRTGFPHRRTLSGIFSRPPYVLFMTYLI